MTEGQELAIEQLEEIETSSDGLLEIVEVIRPQGVVESLRVVISVFCGSYERAANGLPLKTRERLTLSVAPEFPFVVPEVSTEHHRFAGFPHVQWKTKFCLYQSPATEWDCSDGMFGYIKRLDLWLRRGALEEWETEGEPLHPPFALPGVNRMIIPKVNTPSFADSVWYGYAHVKNITGSRVDILGWSQDAGEIPDKVGVTVLLSEPMPFEFPLKISDFLSELIARGVDEFRLLLRLLIAVFSNDLDDPLYFFLGTPNRGMSGAGERQQHLTCWYITPEKVAELVTQYRDKYGSERLDELSDDAAEFIRSWAAEAPIRWCTVREDRPEIVTRRDHDAPVSWFAGKTVSLWGCGALGGHVAEFLVRAGVRKLLLHDSGLVTPGILVRQPYEDLDIGRAKVDALQERLGRIRPGIELETSTGNILFGPLDTDDYAGDADLVIDTTASEPILSKLELVRRRSRHIRVPIISMSIGSRADKGLVTISGREYSGGSADLSRRAKLEACGREDLVGYADEFWPAIDGLRRKIFQPEPGCSESTFVGSAADVTALAAMMLNLASRDLASAEGEAGAHLVALPRAGNAEELKPAHFELPSDLTYQDPHSQYEIRVGTSAWREITAWIERSRRRVGPKAETGGLLFGERDDAAKVIWVTEILGPPPDSQAAASHFVCGVEGTKDANDEKTRRSRGSVQYVGMWHTHPGGSPTFSGTDLKGMNELMDDKSLSSPKPLLMIVGTPEAMPNVATYVFKRSDFEQIRTTGRQSRQIARKPTLIREPTNRIGLALSGGGSRAIAFHLGCLRALHDRGLLSQLKVISSVSGGSVISAMYAYSGDDFDSFDTRVRDLLKRGLTRSILRSLLLSPVAFKSAGTNLIAGSSAIAAGVLRLAAEGSQVVGVDADTVTNIQRKLHAPLMRWTSITSAFEQALKNRLFGESVITDKRRGDLDVVINACELRTGSAFRFGSQRSGCWRYGILGENNIP
nr:ThiF family adenylyltransferase [Pyrinomonadaceae bacterium]